MQLDAKKLAGSDADQKKTLVKLNELVKDAEKRRQDLAGSAELKRELEGLKNMQQGPAEKLGDALKTGNLEKAADELAKLADRLSKNELSEKEREALAKQLAQAQEALKKTVQAHKDAQEQVKQEIEKARKAGDTAKADKLQQQLDKLAQQAPRMDQLAKMAEQLQEASQCTAAGDCQKAGEALSEMGQQLSELGKELDELETLDEALSDMAQAKDSMACEECDGQGCKACMGEGSEFWNARRGGLEAGRGIGGGAPGERKSETSFYDSQVKQEVGKGPSIVTGIAGGPNRKGQVQQEIKGEFTSTKQETAEALSGQRLPHDYRDHAKGYFDALREGSK
jgi:hypothetical protein